MAYNLGSFYERQGRWTLAAARLRARAGADSAARCRPRGGCHFHLGEIALAQDEDAGAPATHFARALEALPNHGKARARLEGR